jgi:uncharacterized Fe-S cluster protein YjdI
VFYDRGRCRHYAECVRRLPQVFDLTRRPWIRADLADAQAVAEVVRRCPTGALHYRLLAEEPEAPTHPTIITPDPQGPLLVRGALSWTLPRARCPRPGPRCAPAAAPRTSPSVTAPAGPTPAPPAAPGTTRRHRPSSFTVNSGCWLCVMSLAGHDTRPELQRRPGRPVPDRPSIPPAVQEVRTTGSAPFRSTRVQPCARLAALRRVRGGGRRWPAGR